MQTNILKGKLRENNLSQKEASEKIGMSLSTFNAKLNGYNDNEFSLSEIKALRDVLQLTTEQVTEIFLN